MCLQALGLDKEIGTFLARLMYKARRNIRAGRGVSKEYMIITRKKVLYGIGQGNGGGPAMLIAHLMVMFSDISAVYMGFAMNCVQRLQEITTVGTGYVDDVTLALSIPTEIYQTETIVHKHIKMSQI